MMVIFAIFAEMKNLMNSTDSELRNESNIFSVDPGINQKRKGNCIPFFFRLIPQSTEKY